MDQYYTLASLLEFGGAVAAVILVTATVGYLAPNSEPYLKWVALAISLGLAYLGAVVAPEMAWTKWVVSFFNGLLIFLAATGANQLAVGPKAPLAAPRGVAGAAPEPEGRNFWRSWV